METYCTGTDSGFGSACVSRHALGVWNIARWMRGLLSIYYTVGCYLKEIYLLSIQELNQFKIFKNFVARYN